MWLLSKVTEGQFVYEIPISAEVAELMQWEDKWAHRERVVQVVKKDVLIDVVVKTGDDFCEVEGAEEAEECLEQEDE